MADQTEDQTPVAILDNESLDILFAAASPMSVSVMQSKNATEFTVEDGSTRSDHVVVNAIEISMELMITEDPRNSFSELSQAMSENRLVTVQTSVASYPNMLITDMPHTESPFLGSAIQATITLTEWREVAPETGSMPPTETARPRQSSTARRGRSNGDRNLRPRTTSDVVVREYL